MDEWLKRLREAIVARPDDVMLRRAFADRLLELGEPRGEFIQLQCALAELPHDAPQRPGLEKAAQVLLDRHREKWIRLFYERPKLLSPLDRIKKWFSLR